MYNIRETKPLILAEILTTQCIAQCFRYMHKTKPTRKTSETVDDVRKANVILSKII